jgi:hypothetical protein
MRDLPEGGFDVLELMIQGELSLRMIAPVRSKAGHENPHRCQRGLYTLSACWPAGTAKSKSAAGKLLDPIWFRAHVVDQDLQVSVLLDVLLHNVLAVGFVHQIGGDEEDFATFALRVLFDGFLDVLSTVNMCVGWCN